MEAQQVPSFIYVLPTTLGATIHATAQALLQSPDKAEPSTLLYAEKDGGFQCRTCTYAIATNATHGRCKIMQGSIHLDDGCCAAWEPDTMQLHLYREQRHE